MCNCIQCFTTLLSNVSRDLGMASHGKWPRHKTPCGKNTCHRVNNSISTALLAPRKKRNVKQASKVWLTSLLMSHKKNHRLHETRTHTITAFLTSKKPTHTIFSLIARRDELLHNTEPTRTCFVMYIIFGISWPNFLRKYYALWKPFLRWFRYPLAKTIGTFLSGNNESQVVATPA